MLIRMRWVAFISLVLLMGLMSFWGERFPLWLAVAASIGFFVGIFISIRLGDLQYARERQRQQAMRPRPYTIVSL